MNPWLHTFLALLPRRPLKSLQIAWWWATRRRVRALGHLRVAAALLPDIYPLWLHLNEPLATSARALAALRQEAETLPAVAVHIHLPGGAGALDAQAEVAINSVLKQSLPLWRLYVTTAAEIMPVLPDDSSIVAIPGRFPSRTAAISHVVEITEATYLVPLAADCALTPSALLAFARMGVAGEAVLYADQDESGGHAGRTSPWLKPEWDEDLFLAQDYLSMACAIPVSAARRAGLNAAGPDDIAAYALLARLLIGPGGLPARHVPHVAVTTPPEAWRRDAHDRTVLVQAVTGVPAAEGPFGTVILRRALPDPLPLVSVVVPTRDRLDLLQTCVEGVLHATDYPDIELVIADNESVEPETLAYLEQCRLDPRVKVVRWPHPYNYSAVNNFAVAQATGPYICLLNNDTEVINPSWLREMMVQAVRPHVGAVGARLLYPDRSVQHAGVVVGMGNAAGHAHRALPDGEPGWFAQSLVTRGATAVTAACLVVAKDKFAAVGGLDEQNLAIAYNDVDLCLKLRAAGWKNIYAAQAVMIHHESKSRGLDFAPEHLARYMGELKVFQERWGTVGFQDPTHHRALDPATDQYRLRL